MAFMTINLNIFCSLMHLQYIPHALTLVLYRSPTIAPPSHSRQCGAIKIAFRLDEIGFKPWLQVYDRIIRYKFATNTLWVYDEELT